MTYITGDKDLLTLDNIYLHGFVGLFLLNLFITSFMLHSTRLQFRV